MFPGSLGFTDQLCTELSLWAVQSILELLVEGLGTTERLASLTSSG